MVNCSRSFPAANALCGGKTGDFEMMPHARQKEGTYEKV
ncbi:hypothetical protein [Oscillospiraceae bacterium]|nr:hypothetical protein [Oscillospiraceae bacterium]